MTYKQHIQMKQQLKIDIEMDNNIFDFDEEYIGSND